MKIPPAMSKITFDSNAEAEEIDQADFEQLHALVRQGDAERFRALAWQVKKNAESFGREPGERAR